jgi:hypothetical protein
MRFKKSVVSDIIILINWAGGKSMDIVIDDPPIKRIFAGFDNMGRALEIIAIEDDEQDRLVVIHAMKLTRKYYFLLNEGEKYEL